MNIIRKACGAVGNFIYITRTFFSCGHAFVFVWLGVVYIFFLLPQVYPEVAVALSITMSIVIIILIQKMLPVNVFKKFPFINRMGPDIYDILIYLFEFVFLFVI